MELRTSPGAYPAPTGANKASIFVAESAGEEVTATVGAYNADGELGDDTAVVTIPANGFVRLNNADLALGHESGGRMVTIRANRELMVYGFRFVQGERAVALGVHERRIVTDPEGPDLVVQSPSSIGTPLAPGQSFTCASGGGPGDCALTAGSRPGRRTGVRGV